MAEQCKSSESAWVGEEIGRARYVSLSSRPGEPGTRRPVTQNYAQLGTGVFTGASEPIQLPAPEAS